jgi:hypothetical protein
MSYQVPEAKNVRIMKMEDGNLVPIIGTIKSFEKLYGVWEYEDANDDPEGDHVYRWYRSVSDDPEGEYIIINYTNGQPYDKDYYETIDYDVNKYILFEVTPSQQWLLDYLIVDELDDVVVGTLIDINIS